MKKSFKPKVKKAQRKARLRRAQRNRPVVAKEPEKPHVYPVEDNQKLHATAQFFSEQARGMERLMERNRWSRQ